MAASDVLTPVDLQKVFDIVNQAKCEWYSIGLQLGVPEGQLNAIKVNFDVCQDCLRETLSWWLRNSESPCTWDDLKRVMRSPTVCCDQLAENLPQSRTTQVVFPCELKWEWGVSATRRMSCPTSAVAYGGTAYFRKYHSREIFSFNCSTKSWNTLPKCLVEDTTLIVIPVPYGKEPVFILHTIGGIKVEDDRQNEDDLYTDALYQLSQDEGKWTESSIYPKMLSKRSQVTAVYHKNILVTAGGRGDTGTTATVEILHSTDRIWYRVTDLPRKQYKASGCVCDGKLYFLGGCEMGDEGPRSIKSVYEVDFMSLEQACTASRSKEIRYNKIASLPLRNSTCVSFFGFILAIGGSDNNKGWVSSRKIHAYHPSSGTWQHLPDSSLLEKRCFCFSVVVDQGDKLEMMVVGGYKTRPDVDCTNSVEVVELSRSEKAFASPASSEYKQSMESSETPLLQEETAALNVVLSNNGVKPCEVQCLEVSPESTLERVQQLLAEKGHQDLSVNLKDKLSEVIQLQKQYLQRIDDLMTSKDTIELRYLKVLLVGPPGVGKTTTLNRLLKLYENIHTAGEKAKRQSTLFANCTQVLAFVGQDNAADWLSSSSGDTDEEAILLIRYLCGGKLEEPTEVAHPSIHKEERRANAVAESVPTQSEAVQEKAAVDRPSNVTGSQTRESSSNSSQAGESDIAETPVSVKRLEHLQKVKEELRKLVCSGNYTKAITHLGNTLLNINDVGGQPGFLEMLPALSTGPAMYLVFLDLSKELDELYEITFNRDDTVITPFKSLHTVESTISQILSSIASAHRISRESVPFNSQKSAQLRNKLQCFQQIQPVAALIGTHLDKLKNREKKLKDTSESLRKVTNQFKEIFIPPLKNVTSSLFYAVNNYDGEEVEDIAPIRNFMNKTFESRYKEATLPVQKKWLILNIILRREYHIVELKDCFELGDILSIDNEEVKFCLWYLNCIGTLMYYTDIADDEDGWFKNHVICSPQVIFDSISRLVIPSLCTLKDGVAATSYEQEELINKGQFSIESLEMHCESAQVSNKLKKQELIPVKKLIQLLKHVNLLSPIIHKKSNGERTTYLMPAVLEGATQAELTTPPPPDADNPEPLLITFKCGYVPTGTFCGLITQLVSCGPDGIFDFVWDLVEDGVKRNLVSFYVDYVNKVTLICHDRCYEVRVTRDDPDISLHTLCAHVLSVILHILGVLYKNLVPEIAFQCPCPKHSSTRTLSNLCTSVNTKKFRFLCERKLVTLNNARKIWIEQVEEYCTNEQTQQDGQQPMLKRCVSGTKDSPQIQGGLTHKEVVKAAKNASARWFDLGIELDIDVNILEIIRKENMNRVDDCHHVMLKYWVAMEQATPTWSALIEALESEVIGRRDIAREIQSQYNIVKRESSERGNAFTLKEVRRATWEVRAKWECLGSELGITQDTLEAFKATCNERVGDCHTDMLIHWFRQPPPDTTLSWSTLVSALRSVDRGDIADHIEKSYM